MSLILALAMAAGSAAPDLGNTQLPDPKAEAQARALMGELRCVVCQGQSIADSDADMAADMGGEPIGQPQPEPAAPQATPIVAPASFDRSTFGAGTLGAATLDGAAAGIAATAGTLRAGLYANGHAADPIIRTRPMDQGEATERSAHRVVYTL